MQSHQPSGSTQQTQNMPAPTHAEETLVNSFGLVFFDGYCGMCNRFVDWLLRQPSRCHFRFAPRQGAAFRTLAILHPWLEHCDSIIYLPPGSSLPLVRSDAVMGILQETGGWRARLASALGIVPKPLRDLGYRVIARLRHHLSRRRTTCRMPTAEERSLFLD